MVRGIDPALIAADVLGPEPDPVPCPFCGKMLRYEEICDRDGEHLLWSPIPVSCTCEGYEEDLRRQESEQEMEREQEKQRQMIAYIDRLVSETLYGSGLTIESDRYTLARYEPRSEAQADALEQVTNYIADFAELSQNGVGMLLAGPNGTGKTHLATACARAISRAGHRGVLYRSATEIITELRSAGDRRIGEATLMRAYTGVPLLIIDDLGKQMRTALSQRWMWEIIEGRYRRNLPIIITTNSTPSEIGDCIGGDDKIATAIMSRLMERMICVPVTGEDYRLRLMHEREKAPKTKRAAVPPGPIGAPGPAAVRAISCG